MLKDYRLVGAVQIDIELGTLWSNPAMSIATSSSPESPVSPSLTYPYPN